MWASYSEEVANIWSFRAIREAEPHASLPWNHPLGPCHPCWEDPGEGQMSKWMLVGAHTPFPPVDPLTWFLLTLKFQSKIIFGSFSTNLFYNLQIGSFDPTYGQNNTFCIILIQNLFFLSAFWGFHWVACVPHWPLLFAQATFPIKFHIKAYGGGHLAGTLDIIQSSPCVCRRGAWGLEL